jgi:acetoin utilization protein AcuB
MVDNKIGSLPVMRGSRLVGIITETDIFRTFVEMLGGRERGVRVTVEVPEGKGVLAAVTGAISDAGGNIVSLATFQGRDPTHRYLTMKVQDMSEDAIAAALGPSGTIVDMQQLSEGYVPTILGRTSP